MKKLFSLSLGVLTSLLTFSCIQDDTDGYSELEIEINSDQVTVSQGDMVMIPIFENDVNVLESASFEIESVEVGTLLRNTNNTENILLDDTFTYQTEGDFIGDIEVVYTVCNNTSNCDSGIITITVRESTAINVAQDFTPHNALSTYNFFTGDLRGLTPNERIIAYKPISSLFSDYALKKRFVYVPEGIKSQYVEDGAPLDFPIGTVIIKNFYYDNVLPNQTTFIIETRLMFKTPDGWTFAEYFWNDEQTEAFLDVEEDGGFKEISWLQDGEVRSLDYRMPSASECFTCHKKNAQNIPIGVKPQNLNSNFNYADGSMNQLLKWQNLGILESNLPTFITSVVDYTDESQALDLRVRSYLDINCASCHSDGGHCDYRSMRFAYDQSELLQNLGVCIDPDDLFFELEDQKIIKPGDPENSVLYARINTIQENRKMPLLGRRSIHAEAVQLVEQWILLLDDCE